MRARAAVALIVAACSSPVPNATPPLANEAAGGPSTPQASTPEAAIDRFIAAWDGSVRPTIPTHKDPLIGQIDESMHEPDSRRRYSAERKSCREASQVMVDLIAQTKYDFVLYGSMDAARAHDQCWAVNYICCMKGDAGALLDPDTGELLVVWRIPEG